MEPTTPRVLIFAKAPIHGSVKTRLAAAIGPDAALAFYRRTLWQTVARLAANADWQLSLAVTPDATTGRDDLWPERVERCPQGDGDLGDRMGRFLATATAARPVIIVGSDIPALEPEHVARAIAALASASLVFGPAADGGYWLIGANRPPPAGLFANVRWSTEHALADTLDGAQGSDVALIDQLRDVDDAAGYQRFMGRG
jgi:uncharacterized protein